MDNGRIINIMHGCNITVVEDLWLTIAERIIAGIPKPRDSKLRIAQIMVVTMARIRKSWGASYGGCGATATVGN